MRNIIDRRECSFGCGWRGYAIWAHEERCPLGPAGEDLRAPFEQDEDKAPQKEGGPQ